MVANSSNFFQQIIYVHRFVPVFAQEFMPRHLPEISHEVFSDIYRGHFQKLLPNFSSNSHHFVKDFASTLFIIVFSRNLNFSIFLQSFFFSSIKPSKISSETTSIFFLDLYSEDSFKISFFEGLDNFLQEFLLNFLKTFLRRFVQIFLQEIFNPPSAVRSFLTQAVTSFHKFPTII